MMIARFRIVGWVAGCAGAALCCYLASQQVAAERLALAKVDREIADTRSDNMRLMTEIATRSRLGQIERWNVSFRLGAPAPRQFLANEVQLAAYAGGKPPPLDPAIVASKGAVEQVAYTQARATASAARPAQMVSAPAAAPLLRQANFVRPKPDRLSAETDAPLVKVAFAKPVARAAGLDGILDDAWPRAVPARTRAVSLLPSDLATLAAAEGRSKHKRIDR